MRYKYMEAHHVMKPILATLATFSILFALACAPVDPPLPCDAAGYDAAEVDRRPTLRVYVSETWPPKITFYVREAFEGLDVRVIEVDSANIADVSIWPVEHHVTDCTYGAGYYTATIYVDWECYWADDLTAKVRELLAHFTPLAHR
jgi:hypothetical protein